VQPHVATNPIGTQRDNYGATGTIPTPQPSARACRGTERHERDPARYRQQRPGPQVSVRLFEKLLGCVVAHIRDCLHLLGSAVTWGYSQHSAHIQAIEEKITAARAENESLLREFLVPIQTKLKLNLSSFKQLESEYNIPAVRAFSNLM
jgi:hypothetical protein